ncbi:MAG: glycosyltransferase family 2 protein [Clostridium sp.]
MYVPIYNVEKYLDRCIKSIINQSYTNLEIILVNDGSTDKCGQICDKWKEKDERIKVIHKENGGLSDARNAGIEIAKGEYLSFIDSDDYVHKDFIKVYMDYA